MWLRRTKIGEVVFRELIRVAPILCVIPSKGSELAWDIYHCVISDPLLFKVSSSSRTFSQIYFGYRGDFLRCAVHWDMEMSLLMKLETETVRVSQAHTEDPAQAFAEADGVHSDRGAGTVADTAS